MFRLMHMIVKKSYGLQKAVLGHNQLYPCPPSPPFGSDPLGYEFLLCPWKYL